jgi:hypothetical protein
MGMRLNRNAINEKGSKYNFSGSFMEMDLSRRFIIIDGFWRHGIGENVDIFIYCTVWHAPII